MHERPFLATCSHTRLHMCVDVIAQHSFIHKLLTPETLGVSAGVTVVGGQCVKCLVCAAMQGMIAVCCWVLLSLPYTLLHSLLSCTIFVNLHIRLCKLPQAEKRFHSFSFNGEKKTVYEILYELNTYHFVVAWKVKKSIPNTLKSVCIMGWDFVEECQGLTTQLSQMSQIMFESHESPEHWKHSESTEASSFKRKNFVSNR